MLTMRWSTLLKQRSAAVVIEFPSVRGQIPLPRQLADWSGYGCSAASAQSPAGGCDFEAALRRHQSGDLVGAAEGYKLCIASQPGRIESRSNLGAVLSQTGSLCRRPSINIRMRSRSHPPEVAPALRLNLALAYYKSFQIPAAAARIGNPACRAPAQPENRFAAGRLPPANGRVPKGGGRGCSAGRGSSGRAGAQLCPGDGADPIGPDRRGPDAGGSHPAAAAIPPKGTSCSAPPCSAPGTIPARSRN